MVSVDVRAFHRALLNVVKHYLTLIVVEAHRKTAVKHRVSSDSHLH